MDLLIRFRVPEINAKIKLINLCLSSSLFHRHSSPCNKAKQWYSAPICTSRSIYK